MALEFSKVYNEGGAFIYNNAIWRDISEFKKIQHDLDIIKPDRFSIGQSAHIDFSTTSLNIEAGDRLYLFSDGYADQFGGPLNKKFGYQQFKNLLKSSSSQSMNKQQKMIIKTFEEWKNQQYEQIDDICLLGLEI